VRKLISMLASLFAVFSITTAARADLIVEPRPAAPAPVADAVFGPVGIAILVIVIVIVAVLLLRTFRKK